MENSEVKEKKKNGKNKMLIVLLMLIMFLIIVLGMIIFVNVYSTKKYQNIEKSMELNVENYITLKKYILDTKDKSIITLKEMKKYHLVSENKCDGYVVMSYSKDDNDFIKNAYIKCGKYKTKGYKEKKAKKNVINLKLDLDSDEKLKKLDLYYDEKDKHVVTSSQKTSYSGRYDCKYLGQYDCKTSKCKYIKRTENVDIYGDLYSDSGYNMVLLYDDEYILYNYETKEIYKTGIKEIENGKINLIGLSKDGKIFDKGFIGLIVNNEYYSMNYKKLVKIENSIGISYVGNDDYGEYGKYMEIYTNKEKTEGYILNILTKEKKSLYLTDEKYNESNFTDDKILAKYDATDLSPVNSNTEYKGSINIIIYANNYMQMHFGNGAVDFGYTRGKYTINNNNFTYSRMYQLESDEWRNLKVSNNFGLSENEVFDINSNNTLSSSSFIDAYGSVYKPTLKQIYSVSNFQLK